MLVMIVGAGPAGLRAAHGLQRQGVPVLLVEPHEVGGTLNDDLDFENSVTHLKTPSLSIKARLLEPWGRSGPPVLHDRVLSADWDRSQRVWQVQMSQGKRVASWLLLANGVVPRTGGFTPSPRMWIGPSKGLLQHPVRGLRVAILGGGDNAFEFACHYLTQGADVQVFLRNLKAQEKFVNAVCVNRLHPETADVREDSDGVWVNGEHFDACFVFYGFEAHPISLTIDHVPLSDATIEDREALPFMTIGDACANENWWVDRALVSADAGVARVVNALQRGVCG